MARQPEKTTSELIIELRERAQKLLTTADVLEHEVGFGGNMGTVMPVSAFKKRTGPRRIMSAEARARISQAQKDRWARAKGVAPKKRGRKAAPQSPKEQGAEAAFPPA